MLYHSPVDVHSFRLFMQQIIHIVCFRLAQEVKIILVESQRLTILISNLKADRIGIIMHTVHDILLYLYSFIIICNLSTSKI